MDYERELQEAMRRRSRLDRLQLTQGEVCKDAMNVGVGYYAHLLDMHYAMRQATARKNGSLMGSDAMALAEKFEKVAVEVGRLLDMIERVNCVESF